MPEPTIEQAKVLNNEKKNLIVSASAGSGKTWVMIEYITKLIVERRVPVRRLLVLTFTRAAAGEMRERLNKALLKQKPDKFILEQIDDLSICDVSTIDAFCEKLVKRNIDKLGLDENFSLIEDPSELKRQAFDKTLLSFSTSHLNEIYYSFRKNKDAIFDCVLKLDDFLAVNTDKNLDYYIDNQEKFFNSALFTLNENLKLDICHLREQLKQLLPAMQNEVKYAQYLEVLINLLSFTLSNDFISNVKNLTMLEVPSVPVIRGEGRDEDLAGAIKAIRKQVKDFLDDFQKYNFDELLLAKQKSGTLAKALLQLYKKFAENYRELKGQDVLDFVDVEKFTLELLKEDEILSSLQTQYDYIFVDEYQDTNRIQEAIVKPLTKQGAFVAVGDPKQGIYGFRNATMEIMQEDIANFLKLENSGVEFLRGNFRSDARLLDFINIVFEKVMKEENVGIDYRATSVLRGEVPFEKMELPSVRIDIVQEVEEEEETRAGVYSVREDELYINEKNKAEVSTIIARVDELLMHKIYDVKLAQMRSVEFDDIVVLFRSRSSLMLDLTRELDARGYPVLSDIKELEIEEPEVQMLVNLLKLLLTRDDDVSLISVLASKFGGFSMDELAKLRQENLDAQSFYEVFKNTDNSKLANFNALLDELKLAISVNGIYRSLIKLMVDFDYFAYLYAQANGEIKVKQVYNFLNDVKAFGGDLPRAISYFNEIGGKKRSNNISGSGAIKIMTIHASKGLEYPIVILAGAGQKLESPNRYSYAINKDYGLATYAFDETSNIKAISPNLEVIRLANLRKEMIDELMIFYVALTRAKNHLNIIGKEKLNNLFSSENFDVLKAKNYLSLIFYAFGKNVLEELIANNKVELSNFEFNFIDEVLGRERPCKFTSQALTKEEQDALEQYFNFTYPNRDCLRNVKNSVTSLNKTKEYLHERMQIEEHQDFITLGNAYHEAMRVLNFDNINSYDELEAEINKHQFKEGELELIDKNILLKNIIKIKDIVKTAKIYKEKKFVMSLALNELFDEGSDDEVLVQGIVDFFALGEENILIDYKFTQEKNHQKILDKYAMQLKLYTKAIEKGFNIKINKKYILSLKNAELIEFFD